MAKKDALLKIDYVPSKNSGNSTTTFSGGTTSVDTSAFLLRDGTRTMLANLDIGGFSIVNVNLLDGVDLPTFLSSYNAHIINANAHHNQAHGLISSDHTVSGLTIGNYLRANSDTSFGFAQIQHSELGGVSANQHHNQIHAIIGSDHTVVGSAFDLIGLSGTNTLSVLTPSANVSTGIERILKSSSSGNLNLASLTTILINSASELTLNPVGNIILDSQAGATIPGGTIQDDLGAYNRKWRTLFAAELYVETLVAQNVISTIGGRIMVAPTTTLIADVSNVATTIDVKHNNLQSGDFVVLQTAPAGIAQIEAMRIISSATTITGGFRYSVTRNLDGSGANNWLAGDAVVDITDGYIDLTSTSTMLNHLGPVVAIYDRTSVGSWNGLTATVAMGNIRNFVDFSTDTFGIAIGNNLTLTPSTGFIGLSADNVNGIRLFNTPLRMFNAAIETIHIAAWNDVWIGVNSSDKRLEWNGSTLTVRGAITIQAGSTGFTNITDRPTTLAGINATEGAKLTGIATGATRNTIYRQSTTPTGQNGDIWYNTATFLTYRHNGSGWEVIGNNYNNTNQLIDGAGLGAMADWNSINSRPARFNFESAPSGQPAGLYMTASSFGFWNGNTFRTYMDNTGRFIFTGASGAYVAWDGTRLFGGTSSTFSTSTANWYVDSTNGALVAGQGNVILNTNGIGIRASTTTYNRLNAFNLLNGIGTDVIGGLDALDTTSESSNFIRLFARNNTKNNTILIESSTSISGRTADVFITSVQTNGSSTISVAGNYGISISAQNFNIVSNTTSTINGNTVWHSGNDGTGSTLDADLLDGNHASAFALLSGATFTGNINALTIGENWVALTPQNNWVNFGGISATLGIKRFGNFVSIKGRIRANTAIAGNTAVNVALATEYRPSAVRLFGCLCTVSGVVQTGRVTIGTDGTIRPQENFATNDWITLEISYFTGG